MIFRKVSRKGSTIRRQIVAHWPRLIAVPAAAIAGRGSSHSADNPPDNEANPWKLIAAVAPQLRSTAGAQRLLDGRSADLSGIRPYVDGRGDMYGDELVLGYRKISNGNAASIRRRRTVVGISAGRSFPIATTS